MVSSADTFHSIAIQLVTENLVVPTVFLHFYKQIGLDDLQLLIILQIMADMPDRNLDEILDELNQKMSSNRESIKKALALLIEKNFLTINGKLQMDKLLMAINKCWQEKVGKDIGIAVSYDEASSLYTIFEQEFGRLLTPMEGEQIREWVEGDQYDYSLIKGALKRSVLRGVLNFKYVDSILREWQKRNFKTIREVIAYESKYSQKEPQLKANKNNRQNKKESNKYKDIYMG